MNALLILRTRVIGTEFGSSQVAIKAEDIHHMARREFSG